MYVPGLDQEAVTTSMTDLAPMFGVKMGEVYITASPNYIDVVTQHSVVIFVPMFIVPAWLCSRYDVRPGSVFVLFGLTGTAGRDDNLRSAEHIADRHVGRRLWPHRLPTGIFSSSRKRRRRSKTPPLSLRHLRPNNFDEPNISSSFLVTIFVFGRY